MKKKISNLSYPSICKIIRKGQVKVNKKKVKNSLILNTGDKVRIYKLIDQEKKQIEIKSSYSRVFKKKMVIFKNKEIIALNKPSGIAVQGGTKVKINIDLLLDSLKFGLDEKAKTCPQNR